MPLAVAAGDPAVLDRRRGLLGGGQGRDHAELLVEERAATAVKNGWIARSDGKWHVNCLAVGTDWVLSVLTVYPSSKGMGYGAEGPLAGLVATATVERLTGIHHFNFNLILAASGLHVLAVLAYRLLKGQDLVRPMVTGVKELPAEVAAPRLGSPLLAATLLGAAALIVWGVTRLG